MQVRRNGGSSSNSDHMEKRRWEAPSLITRKERRKRKSERS